MPYQDVLQKLRQDYLRGAIDAETYARLRKELGEGRPPETVAQTFSPSNVRPLRQRVLWAVIGLVAVIVTDLLAIWSDLLEIDVVNRILDGEAVSDDEIDDNDARQGVVALVQLAVFIGTVVFFIRWFHAAYSNLPVLGQPNIRYGRGWAIGGWFVPILNAWRPKQIANDIWRGGGADAPPLASQAWKDVPVSPLIQLWWAAWLFTNFISNIAGRLWWRGNTLDEIKTAAQVDILAAVTSILAAILAIAVVRAMTSRQEERTRRLATMPPAPVPPDQQSYS